MAFSVSCVSFYGANNCYCVSGHILDCSGIPQGKMDLCSIGSVFPHIYTFYLKGSFLSVDNIVFCVYTLVSGV